MLKTLLNEVKEYEKDSLKAPLYMVGEVAMEIIIPLLMAAIIDKGVENENIKMVIFIGISMFVIASLSLTFGVLSGKYAASASAGFAKNLRKAMFDNIQDFSFSNIDKYSTAGLITRLTTDVTNVQNSYQMLIRTCVRAPLMLIGAMAMAFSISPKLSFVFLGAIVFLSLVLYLIMKTVHPIFTDVFKKYDDLNSSVQENVNAIRVVKAYVREDYEIEKFHNASSNVYKLFVKAEKVLILNMPSMQFAMYTCILLISWLGAKMIVSNELTTGELMSFFTYIINILMSLMMISMMFVMITMSKASAERIVEVIKEESDISNPKNPIKEIKDGSIEFDNVNFAYKKESKKYVLSNVNLKINSGETIGILGGTGSAKSSLVQLIPRLYDVSTGSVKVSGIDVRDYDLESLRDEVAMVLQKNVLFSGTIKENLRWGNENATDEELIRACKLAQADEFINKFPDGYDTYIEQGGSNVSGGQKTKTLYCKSTS